MTTLVSKLPESVHTMIMLDTVTPPTPPTPSSIVSINNLASGATLLLLSLRRGQRWLTEQWLLSLADDPTAASEDRLSAVLAGWDALERVFRCSGYTGCIWGESGACPNDAPGICDGCAEERTKRLGGMFKA